MKSFTALLAMAVAPIATLPAAAQTLDLPPRKAGLWQVTTVSEGAMRVPPITVSMCLDAATDGALWDYVMKKSWDGCKLAMKHEGKTRLIDADCPSPLLAMRSKTEITGDFQAGYTIKTEAAMQLGPRGGWSPPTFTTQTAKWQSADCPGLEPGDITVFKDLKINIKKLTGAK